MGILDKVFGGGEEEQSRQTQRQDVAAGSGRAQSGDEQAIARYRYMLKTAPPETIEQAHAEAFAKLTPEQRRTVLEQLNQDAPEGERAATKDDPQSLARAATRAEVRQPGTIERTLGGGMGGMGMGGMMAGSFLSSIAGVVVGSAIAQSFFGNSDFGGGDFGGAEGADQQNAGEADAGQGDVGQEGGDGMSADAGGDFGGDFGGGDFGDF